MGCNEKWHDVGYYRMDRITEMALTDRPATPLRSLSGYEKGIDYKKLATALPYMFSDEPVRIEFLVDERAVDDVIDWFGKSAELSPADEGRLKAEVTASPSAMVYWAMQYLNFVEVLSPAHLREKIAENIEKGLEKYRGQ